MSDLWVDLRFAARTLLRAPIFTLVAVVTLALGVGANSAIFSVVNGVLLSPLPYPTPESLVWVAESQPSRGRTMAVAWANFEDWRERSRSFTGLAAFGVGSATVLGTGRPLRATVARVSEDFWEVFPVSPVMGRLTVAADHVAGVSGVVVLREDFWRNELGAAALDGIVLEIGGDRLQAVGVVPASMDFPARAQLWKPASPSSTSRTAHNWRLVGRLADGVTLAAADAELDDITRAIVTAEPADPEFLAEEVLVIPLREQVSGSARQPLLLLLGAAGLVLLVACANLASTLLARGEARLGEMAVRASLGAGRGRLIRQLVTESVVLSAMGGLVGLVFAAILLRGLRRLSAVSIPRLNEISIDPTVFVFTGAVVLVTAFLFGLLPALRVSRADLASTLKSGSRGGTHRRSRVWPILVGSEVALAFVLLVGSGLLVRSFVGVMGVDRGFQTAGVLTAEVQLSLIKYPTPGDHSRFYQGLVEELERRPEIESAGVVSSIPLSGFLPNGRMELDGDMSKHAVAGYVAASPGYFAALGIPLVRGRLFDGRDGPDAAHAAIVSQSFADAYWPGEDPVGKQVTGGGMDEFWEDQRFATVVGVVGDARYRALGREAGPVAYFPASQRSGRLRFNAALVVRAARNDTGAATAGLRKALSRLDPDVPPRFATMESRVRRSMAERRFMVSLLGGFALVALILAAVGIYGVVSYSVARRVREIGIRLALGAEPRAVRREVQTRSMSVVALGAGVGLVATIASSRLLASMLYGVSPSDPVTLAAVALALLAAGWVAAAIPSARSTRVDPTITMRTD